MNIQNKHRKKYCYAVAIFIFLLGPIESVNASESTLIVDYLSVPYDMVDKKGGGTEELKRIIDANIISNYPNYEQDYDKYFYVNKEKVAEVLDVGVLSINIEYMKEYAGCCVNPGISVIFKSEKKISKSSKIYSFSKSHHCSISGVKESNIPGEVLSYFESKVALKKMYLMSCKESDNQLSMLPD
jgi:hypothetical protein